MLVLSDSYPFLVKRTTAGPPICYTFIYGQVSMATLDVGVSKNSHDTPLASDAIRVNEFGGQLSRRPSDCALFRSRPCSTIILPGQFLGNITPTVSVPRALRGISSSRTVQWVSLWSIRIPQSKTPWTAWRNNLSALSVWKCLPNPWSFYLANTTSVENVPMIFSR